MTATKVTKTARRDCPNLPMPEHSAEYVAALVAAGNYFSALSLYREAVKLAAAELLDAAERVKSIDIIDAAQPLDDAAAIAQYTRKISERQTTAMQRAAELVVARAARDAALSKLSTDDRRAYDQLTGAID